MADTSHIGEVAGRFDPICIARQDGPRDGVQLAGRDDDDRPVAQMPDGRSEQRMLECRSRLVQHGQRAGRVGAGPAAGQAAQGETSEIRGLQGVAGLARRELPYAARSADQDMQVAVDVDDLDQLGRAELVEQVGRAERSAGPPPVTPGSQCAGAHLGF